MGRIDNQSRGQNARLEVVDVLRGFALMGLFLVHMLESYELYWVDPKPGIIVDTVFLLLMGKSFSLLALCFGFSFFILMDRAAKRGTDFSARFAWRLLILEGIGFLHSLIYRGDIIQTLAAMGMLLLVAHRVRSNRVLVAAAIFCFLGPSLLVQMIAAASGAAWANAPAMSSSDPGMPIYLTGSWWQALQVNLWAGQVPKYWFFIEYGRLVQILGLFLLGMVLGRIGFFGRLQEFRRARAIALVVALAVAIGLYFGREPLRLAFASLGYGGGAERAFWALTGSWLDLAGTACWALLLMALYESRLRWLVHPFAAPGRLTLTFYIAQSAVFVPIFYGYGLGMWDDWGEETRLLVALIAIAFQMWFAAVWLTYFQYGPIEWVWRALTFWSVDVPFRRRTSRMSAPAQA